MVTVVYSYGAVLEMVTVMTVPTSCQGISGHAEPDQTEHEHSPGNQFPYSKVSPHCRHPLFQVVLICTSDEVL
ncbi:MAG: hypothetical protein Kow0099_28160 [Candidatus Abyssubacteria bacterium]